MVSVLAKEKLPHNSITNNKYKRITCIKNKKKCSRQEMKREEQIKWI